MAVILFALDLFSDDPSTTAVLVFPVFGIYAAVAIGVIALVDWAVRRLRSRR